jgi:hypothetical protein
MVKNITKNKSFKRLFYLFIFYIMFSNTYAATYYVNDGSTTGDRWCAIAGNNTSGTGTAALPFLTLTKALTVATTAGDSIKIDQGTYTENTVPAIAVAIVIYGAGNDRAIFSSNTLNKFFITNVSANVVFQEITISEYSYTSGGKAQAIQLTGTTTNTVSFKNVIFKYNGQKSTNSASYSPLFLNNANVSVIINGGGFLYNGLLSSDGSATYNGGGGVDVIAAKTVSITGCVFGCNAKGGGSVYEGGAIHLANASSTVTINNCIFDGNGYGSNNIKGGTIWMDAGILIVNNSVFQNARYPGVTPSNSEGGIVVHIEGGTATFNGCLFQNNNPIYGSNVTGGAIEGTAGTINVDNCKFSGNQTNSGTSKGSDIATLGAAFSVSNSLFQSVATQIYRQTGGSINLNNNCEYTSKTAHANITNTSTVTVTFTDPSSSCPSYGGTCSASTFSILPIELTRFEGDCNNGNVILNWQTATEKNNSVFNIQRSGDGVYFETIGSVAGAGNSVQLKNYTFIDEDEVDGISYYRLSQTDVEHVCGDNQESVIDVYPNPAQSNFIIDVKLYKKANVSLDIMDALGRNVNSINNRKYDIGIQSIDVNATDLETGIYFIKVSINDKHYIEKIIKL